jgi:hypothetical protein
MHEDNSYDYLGMIMTNDVENQKVKIGIKK